jgi:hypothetical protein
MTRNITINQFKQLPDETFVATGNVDDRPFTASTIKYRGEPIFKVLERDGEGGLGKLRLDKSSFTRGDRIAIARVLKVRRVALEEATVRVAATQGSASREDLETLSVAELRTLCKDRGVGGYYAKGVTKTDLVDKLAA